VGRPASSEGRVGSLRQHPFSPREPTGESIIRRHKLLMLSQFRRYAHQSRTQPKKNLKSFAARFFNALPCTRDRSAVPAPSSTATDGSSVLPLRCLRITARAERPRFLKTIELFGAGSVRVNCLFSTCAKIDCHKTLLMPQLRMGDFGRWGQAATRQQAHHPAIWIGTRS
jgi:hypothetical protein